MIEVFHFAPCQQQAEREAQEEEDDEYDEFNPYLFIKQLPPYDQVICLYSYVPCMF